MKGATVSQLLEWFNDRIASGDLSLDEELSVSVQVNPESTPYRRMFAPVEDWQLDFSGVTLLCGAGEDNGDLSS